MLYCALVTSLSLCPGFFTRCISLLQEGRPEDRNAADKAKLEAKVAAKKAMKEKEAEEQDGTKAPVARKKKDVKNASLDDLLDAGLTKAKKK